MKTEKFIGSNETPLATYLWDEVKKPKAVVQIIHGMQEHAKRYDHFAKFLNSKGYIVFASDLRCHGQTAGSVEMLGVTNTDVFNEIVSDQIKITNHLKNKFDLPVYIFGHSFGSFITQRYVQVCNLSTKAVICGSAHTKSPLILFAKLVANLTALFKGNNATAKLIEKLSFGTYAKAFENGNWLTSDEKIFEEYKLDPYCGTPFPAGFYKSMFKNTYGNYKNLKLITPDQKLLLISGTNDPVGGKDASLVKKLHKTYLKNKVNAELKLYAGMRHEILNELNKEQVYADVVNFFDK